MSPNNSESFVNCNTQFKLPFNRSINCYISFQTKLQRSWELYYDMINCNFVMVGFRIFIAFLTVFFYYTVTFISSIYRLAKARWYFVKKIVMACFPIHQNGFNDVMMILGTYEFHVLPFHFIEHTKNRRET